MTRLSQLEGHSSFKPETLMKTDTSKTPAVSVMKRLVLNDDVWRILEEDEKPIESLIFPRETADDTVLPSFDGNQTWRESLDWLRLYCQWANQEGLSDERALLYVWMHLKNKAGRYAQEFPRIGTWVDFLKGFFDRYVPYVDSSWFLQWYRNDRKKNQIVWYTAREISKGTNYFSQSNCLGEDKFGKVYHGSLSDKQTFSVRKFNKNVTADSLLDVIKEARLSHDVLAFSHPNVLKLLGFSFSERVPLLLYDLVPNGTLEQHLLRKTGEELYWGTRLTVAIDVADAIRHLHSSNYSQTPICHRDVKSYNILLDHDCRAKLGGYGIEDDVTKEVPGSNDIKNSRKFLDAQKRKVGQMTNRTDVYSYGVLLMELVSGKKAWVSEVSSELFPDLWQMKRESNRLDDILDPYLNAAGSACMEAFKEVIFLAVKCCSMRVDSKQTMATVATELRSILRKGVTAEIQRLSKHWKATIENPQPGSINNFMKHVEKLERVLDHPSVKVEVSKLLGPSKNLKSSLLDDLRTRNGVCDFEASFR